MAAVQQLTKEMRALREELGATRAELAEVRDAAATRVAVAELHDEVSVVRGDVRDAHDRLVGMAAVPGAVDSNSSAIRTLQRDAEDSRASTKAVVEATEIVTQELSHQHQQLSELRAAHQSAASALAQDVAMLADSLAAHKSRTSKEHEDATARCREMEETVDAGRRTDASVLESVRVLCSRSQLCCTRHPPPHLFFAVSNALPAAVSVAETGGCEPAAGRSPGHAAPGPCRDAAAARPHHCGGARRRRCSGG